MITLSQFDEPEDDGTVFRDVITLCLFGFVTIVVLLLPHLNPPTKAEETLIPPGNLVVWRGMTGLHDITFGISIGSRRRRG